MAKTDNNYSYKTIRERTEASFIEKKSEFIGYLCPVSDESQAIEFINGIKSMHRKARHNCYAYIIRDNNIVRHSDDGEPGGTAGMPILEVLQGNELTDVVCVVTRYFGGILLGTGGLVRAYSKAASLAVDSSEIVNMEISDVLKISIDYSFYGTINSIVLEYNGKINSTDFSDSVVMDVFVKKELTSGLINAITEKTCGKANIDILSCGFNEF